MTTTAHPKSVQCVTANPWLPRTAVIDSITPEIAGVATYHLRFRDPEFSRDYRFRPGQFNMLYLPGAGEAAISLSADPQSRECWAHTIRTAGNVTSQLAALRPGDTLGLRGPFGSAWPVEAGEGGHVIVAAGGIGLAPLRSAIYELLSNRDRYSELTLLYGARTPEMLLYPGEYDDWSARGLNVQTTVDRAATNWAGNVGVVPLLLDRLPIANPERAAVLICGPEVMMRFCARSAMHRGIPRERIWISAERNMQCAVGFCGHCQWGPDFVCKDGPVFRYDRVESLFTVDDL